MSPGRLSKFSPVACIHCGALYTQPSAFHAKDCPRNPYCSLCGLKMLPGEERVKGQPLHLDCHISYLEHLDEDHSRG